MGGPGSGRRKKPKISFEFRDFGYKKLIKEIKKLDGSYTVVGWFGSGGSPSEDVASRAAVNEFGATIRVTKRMRGWLAAVLGVFLKKTTNVIRIPARPFVKKTFSLYKRKLAKQMDIEYNRLLNMKQGAKKTLARIGEWYTGRIKYVITKIRFQPNSSITIKRKGSSNTLIDAGEMRNSTTHREIMK